MTDTLLISELATRSGFSPSALRYYERVGLLNAADRSRSGYRLYDHEAVIRLRFIERAKQLGLPLDEIRALVGIWDNGQCTHVREQLRTQVIAKSTEVRERISELTKFADQLSEAVAELSGPSAEGSCDADCGCAEPRTADGPSPQLVALGPIRGPSTAQPDNGRELNALPVACTLAPADQRDRLQDWQAELDHVDSREPVPGGIRLHFPPSPGLAGRLADLAASEQACCSFLTFAIRPAATELVMDVLAPDDALPVVYEMFGTPS